VLVEWTMEEATVALAEVERVVAKGGGAPWFPTPSPDSAPQRLNLPNPVPESVLIPRFIGLLLRFRVLSISSNSWGAVVDEFSRGLIGAGSTYSLCSLWSSFIHFLTARRRQRDRMMKSHGTAPYNRSVDRFKTTW
jgi:hypothetical protein